MVNDSASTINGFIDFAEITEMNELQKLREVAKCFREEKYENILLDYFVKMEIDC